MKATEFEFRHPELIHFVVVWLGLQAYVIDHDDIIWAMLKWITPGERVLARVIFGFAALLVGVAASIRTWARACAQPFTIAELIPGTRVLTAEGPYRYVRNPLYLGTLITAMGMSSLLSRLGLVILLGGTLLRVLRLIGREEEESEQTDGEAFREFATSVPQLVPSLYPRASPGSCKPRWGEAVRREAFTWGCFVTMTGFAITLLDRVAWILGGVAVLGWLFANLSGRRTVVAAV